MKKLWWSLSLIYVSICLPFSFPSVSRKSVWIYILVLNFHNVPSFNWQTTHAPIGFEPTILLSAHSYGKRECQLSQRLRAYWLHSAPCHCIFSWVQVALHIYYLEHELVVLAVFEISVSKWYWSLNCIILWKVIQNKYDGISLKLLLIAFDKYDGNFWTHAHVSM